MAFNLVRPVGELKFCFFPVNYIQDEKIKVKRRRKKKNVRWDPEERKYQFFFLP